MKVLIVIARTLVCMMLLVAPAASDVTYNIDTDRYTTFIDSVRNEVRDRARSYYGIPMIRQPNPRAAYFYINLDTRAAGATRPAIRVTLQMRSSDLYLLGYRDQVNGNDRAFYFKGTGDETHVFPAVRVRNPTRCGFSYDSIEGAAHQLIENLDLKVKNLEDEMRETYGRTDITGEAFKKAQARFLLIAIVLIPEAARFKYIEKRTDYGLKSDYEVKSLVKAWDPLSEEIASATQGVFTHPVTLQVAPGKVWVIKNVDQIKPDMGILKYVRLRSFITRMLNYFKPTGFIAADEL